MIIIFLKLLRHGIGPGDTVSICLTHVGYKVLSRYTDTNADENLNLNCRLLIDIKLQNL